MGPSYGALQSPRELYEDYFVETEGVSPGSKGSVELRKPSE